MLSWFSAIGGFLNSLLGISAAIERWQAKRQGAAGQSAKDTAAELKTVERERDAAEQAGSAEDAARRGKF